MTTPRRFVFWGLVAFTAWLAQPANLLEPDADFVQVRPAHAAKAVCGDFACDNNEDKEGHSAYCPEDCFPTCGDDSCHPTEECGTSGHCVDDCGECPAGGCGDYVCSTATETCSNCSTDCGECPGGGLARDWLSCPTDLTICDETTTACCRRSFGTFDGRNAIIIPMDRCHQPIPGGGKYDPPGSGSAAWCVNPGVVDSSGNGMIEAYGLVYRLMQEGIPVYWAINPTKDPQALDESQSNVASQTYSDRDIDLWVLSPDDADGQPPNLGDSLAACDSTAGCRSPIVRINPSDFSAVTTYSMREFPVRGGAFLIAAADRDRFQAFVTRTGEFAGYASNALYDFSAVDMYEVQDEAVIKYQDFRSVQGPYPTETGAPVAVTINYQPPRLAVQGPGGPATNWLAAAKLDDAAGAGCETGADFSPSNAVYCVVTNENIEGGNLISGEFDWAWLHTNGLSCDAMDQLARYMTAEPGVRDGKAAVFMEAAFETENNCTSDSFIGIGDSGTGVSLSTDSGAAPYILRFPSNMFSQIGDIPAGFASGSPNKWSYDDGSFNNLYRGAHYAYDDGGTLVRLVSEDYGVICGVAGPLNKSRSSCDRFLVGGTGDTTDMVAFMRYNNGVNNGIAFYITGNNVSPTSTTAHLRMMLNALIALPTTNVDVTPEDEEEEDATIEVSRSAPILARGYIYAGSMDRSPLPVTPTTFPADGDNFVFPWTTGHFRAESTFDGTVAFDTNATGIPTPNVAGCTTQFSSACRTVLTNVVNGQEPDLEEFSTASRTLLEPLLEGTDDLTTDQIDELIRKVLQGHKDTTDSAIAKLGGVDRSTSAIIGMSPLAGESRPTMAYFGALDGGLHAVCADTVEPCTAVGQELWWYIPRTQLGLLRNNTQGVNGAPNVVDVFGDLDNDGVQRWHTVLVFQTGIGDTSNSDVAPSIVAMDVTFPNAPRLLWERRATGHGLRVATGPVRISGIKKTVTFAVTNLGTGVDSGFALTAYDIRTGVVLWSSSYVHPDARDSSHANVPDTGMPGGVAGIDMTENNSITHLVIPTLYGAMYLVDASTGANVHGTTPLFQFRTDYHPIGVPPTLYKSSVNGQWHVAFGSGGYADPNETSWSPETEHQYVISVSLEAAAGSLPVTDDPDNDFGGARAFMIDLGAGQRVFSQVVVSGDELFVLSESEDINLPTYGFGSNTGTLTRYDLGDGSVKSTHTVASGSGGLDVGADGSAVITGSGGTVTLDAPTDYDSAGETAELTFQPETGRSIWLTLD